MYDSTPTASDAPEPVEGAVHSQVKDAFGETPTFRMRTDVGNAERLADRGDGKLLWVYGMGWLYWDGTRWRRDESNRVTREAVGTVRSIYREAEALNRQAGDSTDADEREKWAEQAQKATRWAAHSEAASRIASMVRLGQAQKRLVLEEGARGLDAMPDALNVANGVLDLGTLTLRPHDPSERHTRVANALYDDRAEAPFFLQCVERALPDPELRRWVQKAAGYSLRGGYSEYLFIPHGAGANLKSTVLYAWRHALGDYATEAASDLLVARREWNAGSESALAGLHGRRFVTATETEQGKHLAEVLAKKLTGEPEITAKFMRQDYFTYQNQMAVWLATNYKPVVQGMDVAIWRRIRLIPFEVTIPPEDRLDPIEVQKRLRTEADGVLAWMVEGLRLHRAEGLLPEPEAVTAATREYREEMDPLSAWLDDRCAEDPEGIVPIDWIRGELHGTLRRRREAAPRRAPVQRAHGAARVHAAEVGSVVRCSDRRQDEVAAEEGLEGAPAAGSGTRPVGGARFDAQAAGRDPRRCIIMGTRRGPGAGIAGSYSWYYRFLKLRLGFVRTRYRLVPLLA